MNIPIVTRFHCFVLYLLLHPPASLAFRISTFRPNVISPLQLFEPEHFPAISGFRRDVAEICTLLGC
jgi:hypothetical protein